MKKIVILVSILIILFSLTYYAQAVGLNGEYDSIKIGLFFDSTAKKSVTLSSDSGLVVGYTTESYEFVEIGPFENTSMTVSIDDLGCMSIDGLYQNSENHHLEVYAYDNIVNVNGAPYRGYIILTNKNGLIQVVNEVDIEEYLYSVIGKEMSPSWHIEALKAQAICARTYAINNWNKYASKGFNLCATQMSQVYPGIVSETESTVRAVEETKGQIVKYNGNIAQTFFYSSSGGKTADVKYVWGSSFPYLVSVDDSYEDAREASSAWSVTFTKNDIMKKLTNAGVDVGNVKKVYVDSADNGTVYKVVIEGDKGDYVLKNERTRTFFGVKSQYYTINGAGSSDNADLVTLSNGLNEFSKTNASNIINLLSEDNMPKESDTFTFNGRGWGHRIGMSQYGAKKMAEAGFSADKILMHYFPGTTVE